MYNTIESVNESTEALCRKLSTIKVNENKALYFKALRSETIKKLFSFMSNLQTYYHFKLDFPKVNQHTGLTHGTKRRKDNQLQSLELPYRIS